MKRQLIIATITIIGSVLGILVGLIVGASTGDWVKALVAGGIMIVVSTSTGVARVVINTPHIIENPDELLE